MERKSGAFELWLVTPLRPETILLGRLNGILARTCPAAVVLIPVVFPISEAMGIDPIHFNIVQTAAVGIGLFLPPMGVGLLMALRFAKLSVGQQFRTYVPYMAALFGGLPDTVPAVTVNKVCGSGLKAVMLAAQAIKAGDADVIVAGGMESMTRAPFLLEKARYGPPPLDLAHRRHRPTRAELHRRQELGTEHARDIRVRLHERMPHARQGTRQGARHTAATRLRQRTRQTTRRIPSPHEPRRDLPLLAMRCPDRPARVAPRARRPRPIEVPRA